MKLLHLYHDIMNLYGEYANVLALRDILRKGGVDVEVEKKSFGEKVNFADYDFVYVGSGTERNQKLVLEDFRRLEQDFRDYVGSGKPALWTGNSFEILGSAITDASGKSYDGIGMFGFQTTEQNKSRNTSDAIFEADFLDRPLVGFVNKCSEIRGIERSLFRVKMGRGNTKDGTGEGIRQNNLFCTHLTGPVLMKNPDFLVYVAKLMTGKALEPNPLAENGYAITLRELSARLENGNN